MQYVMPNRGKDPICYQFWIISSRGTDVKHDIYLQKKMKKEDIQYELEDWCSQFGCWDSSENMVRYGFKKKRIKKIRDDRRR